MKKYHCNEVWRHRPDIAGTMHSIFHPFALVFHFVIEASELPLSMSSHSLCSVFKNVFIWDSVENITRIKAGPWLINSNPSTSRGCFSNPDSKSGRKGDPANAASKALVDRIKNINALFMVFPSLPICVYSVLIQFRCEYLNTNCLDKKN